MSLVDWQGRLSEHFERLHLQRSTSFGTATIFGLEHGLQQAELDLLSGEIRGHIAHAPPSDEHRLPWIVCASEFGYQYSGDEYWQTFEDATPGWQVNGDRHWIRDCFDHFHRHFNGAKPTGPWSEHFSIICWPITHAILPRDLQRQLARVLYELRHSFSAELFESPSELGKRIAARSWATTSRFQNFVQEELLVGQIAVALLLEGDLGTNSLLLPATLKRIGSDLDRERRARDWLKSARHLAQERARFRGLAPLRAASLRTRPPTDHGREEVVALGIEPRLILRPTDVARLSWEVLLEIPDLSHLILKFPGVRESLESRCVVAGAFGSPLARGKLLHGSQPVRLARWPSPDEILLKFDRTVPHLEYLLRTECLLRPGPTWLFRVATDGLAYELRGMRVRPGHGYIIVSTSTFKQAANVQAIVLSCENVHGVALEVPPALSEDWTNLLHSLCLSQAKSIEVWPVGLAASRWDGEGRSAWLATERPCIAIRSDHAVASIDVSLSLENAQQLRLQSIVPGEPAFVELPQLPVGLHHLRVCALELGLGAWTDQELNGELELLIREPRTWVQGPSPQGPLVFQVEPTAPTLEQLWEGQVDIRLYGPTGRQMNCVASLFEFGQGTPSVSKRLPPLELPITASTWRSHFEKHFERDTENQYDLSRACRLEFSADELGAFELLCEREFTPLRWATRTSGHGYSVLLLDDSGATSPAIVNRFAFEAADIGEELEAASVSVWSDVPPAGGMYVARRGESVAAVIMSPAVRRFDDLKCSPRILNRGRSVERAEHILGLIGIWARARRTGNLWSVLRQRDVLVTLTKHLFFVFGGDNWERAELSGGDGEEGLNRLKIAVSRDHEGISFAAALLLHRQDLARLCCTDRALRFSELAVRYLRLRPPASGTVVWLTELALRLASDPAGVKAWAGPDLTGGVTQLFEIPTLIRAARFMVLAMDRHVGMATDRIGRAEAGWEWK